MKTIFRLICGLMAIALTTACTNEELLQTENLQQPSTGKMINVKAYTPGEQPATRLAFEDKATEGLALKWSEGDAFTALIGEEISIDFGNCVNTSNATNMFGMFSYCFALSLLDVSSFNTANVTNMSFMFSDCQALTSIDVSNFNTSNVTNMSSMFNWCFDLTSLDLSSFDFSAVTDFSNMFNYLGLSDNVNKSTIYVKDAVTQTLLEGKIPASIQIVP